jgi:hypothetical protein
MRFETNRHKLLRILKAATVYFALVFGAGFVLGPIRVLFIVPRFGVRMALQKLLNCEPIRTGSRSDWLIWCRFV